jgi:GNAT acetyltransferase-like protein
MTELGPVAWPPAPIRTERLVLREPEARDRAAVIELFASPEVGTYIGGPRPRDELERAVPEVPKRRPGLFVVDLDGAMIGVTTLDRRAEASARVTSSYSQDGRGGDSARYRYARQSDRWPRPRRSAVTDIMSTGRLPNAARRAWSWLVRWTGRACQAGVRDLAGQAV